MTDRSPRRRLLVAAVALLAIALTGGVLAAPAATAPPDPCGGHAGNGTTVVVTPPTDAPIGPDGTVPVYRGSEIVVHLCGGDGARSLDASGQDWASAIGGSGDGDDGLRVRVTGSTNDSVGDLASPGAVPGPSLVLVDRTVETALVNRSLPVASAEQRTALREAEANYLRRERALESQLASLAAATDAVANGSTPAGEPIAETMDVRRPYRNATERLRAALYAVADSSVGGPGSAAATLALDDRSTAIQNRTRQRLRTHDETLRDRQRSLTWSLRLRLVGLGLLGIFLGGLAGAILPIRRGRAARRRLAAGEWTTYSKRALLLPVAVGLVLLVVGVGWLFLEAGAAIAEVTPP